MLTHEEVEAILERKRADSATEADLADLRRSLKLEGEIVQIGLQQGQYNVDIGKVEGQDIQFGDRIYYGADAEAIREMLREVLGLSGLLHPSLEEQREAVCQFLRSVYERFSSVEFLHRRGEKVALRDQYIPIQVMLDKQPEKSSAGRYLGYVESEAELQRAYALKKEDDQREQVDWQEAKQKHQRIMVLADPGMGKTTLLRMEAGTLAEQEQQALDNGSKTLETVMLPVWLRLSNLAELVQQATDTVLEAILKLVKAEWDEQQFARLQPSLKDKLEKGQCLLLLDALDEVPRQLRDRLSERLEVFAREYPCSIICTSRIAGYTSLLKGATQVEIVPFRQEQTRIYIEKWFTNAADTLNKTVNETVSAKNLIQELKSKPQVGGLATNPLLLSLVCSLYQEKGIALPARRCQVYTQAVEYMLLGKWNSRSRKPEGAKLQSKTRLLEYLAYQFTYEGVEIFSADQLYIKLGEYFSNTQNPMFKIFETEDPVEELTNEDGILQKLSDKEYLFFHRTFQEYFTASYLVRAGKEGIALAKAHLWNFEWHETISLMAGLMEESLLMEKPLDLIEEVVKEKDDIFQTRLLLAGRCIAECSQISDPLIDTVIDRIYQFWQQYPEAEFIRSAVVVIGQTWIRLVQKLQTALNDEDSSISARAVEALKQIGSDKAVDALISALHDEDSDVKSSAAEALEQIGSDKAVNALISAIDNEDSDVRWRAVKALKQIGSDKAVNALISALNHEDRSVRRSAARVLGQLGSDKAVDALISALHDEDRGVRYSAAMALAQIGSDKAVNAFISALNHDEDLDFRRLAAMALAQIGSDKAVDALILALHDQNSYVSYEVAEALKQMGCDKAVNAFISDLNDEDRSVRRSAAEALGQMGCDRAADALFSALNDEVSEVRWSAVKALEQIGSDKAVDAFIVALNDEDSYVRRSAAEALKYSDVSYEVAEALGQMGSDKAVDALISDLNDENCDVRRIAAQVLGQMGSDKVVDALISALNDEVSEVRWSAVKALAKIGSDKAVDALISALHDEDSSVRYSAAKALAKIGSEQAVLAKLLQLSNLDIFRSEFFLFARQLAIQVSRKGADCVPVYPERVRSLT